MSGYEAPRDTGEAERMQEELRSRVELADGLSGEPAAVAGLDVSYERGSNRLAGAAAAVDLATLETRAVAGVYGEATFPYVPGLLGFREVPVLLDALDALARLTELPEVLVCDGYGLAHPRRFGLACHIGVLTGVPAFGVAKQPFLATFIEPGPRRGDWSPLIQDGEVVGRALRTRTRAKPVFVSVGHRISLDRATDLTLKLSRHYRIPEAIREADRFSRAALKQQREH